MDVLMTVIMIKILTLPECQTSLQVPMFLQNPTYKKKYFPGDPENNFQGGGQWLKDHSPLQPYSTLEGSTSLRVDVGSFPTCCTSLMCNCAIL